MQKKTSFFLVLGVPTFGGSTWLGQNPKFFQKFHLKAPLNVLNLCLERSFLTLEQHWSLTQALLLWPTSCQRTSAVPPQCSEAPRSSSDSRRRSDSRSGALSAPATCSPPRHAPFPRLTLEVLILLIGYRRRILLNYCHG